MKKKSSLKLLIGLAAFTLPLSACSFLFPGRSGNNTSSEWNWNSGYSQGGGNSNNSSPSQVQYHTVNFDTRGGDYYFSSQTVRHGERIYNPGDPWKNGCDFNYWETKDGVQWNFNTDVVLEDMTLYANYTPHTYQIYLNLNGGTLDSIEGNNNNYIEVKYGESFELPTPKKGGYSFAGWYNGDQVVNTTYYNYTYSITVDAHWGPLFVVHFDTNGGLPLDDYEGFGTRILSELPEPEKNNSVFLGWTYNGKTVVYPFEVGENVSEITVKATWKEIKNAFDLTDLDNETAKINGYNGTETDLQIPSIINNKKVVEIAKGAFEDNAKITRIELPKSTTTIGENAFKGMAKLEELIMKAGVTTVGENILLNCPKLAKISVPTRDFMLKSFFDYDEEMMPSELLVTLVNPIERSEDKYSSYYYSGDNNNSPRVYPSSGVFKNLVDIKYDVAFDGSWLFVPSSFFSGNKNIKTVSIPGSVLTIGSSSFGGCTYLEKVTLSEGIDFIDSSAFYSCDALKSIVIPDSVTSMSGSVFSNCDLLSKVTIGSGLKSIPSSTFYYCPSLKEIEIPTNITSIGSSAFYDCDGLISVIIPSSVTTIESQAFYSCGNLSTLILPTSVTTIGVNAFSNSALSYVFYGGTKSQWNRIDMGTTNSTLTSAQIEFESKIASLEFVSNDKYSYLLTNDKRIVGLKILDKTITSFDFAQEFPNNKVVSLATNAFSDCDSLVSITIPDTITIIPTSAFYSCNKLEEIILPNTVTSIKSNAFHYCGVLKTISLPNSLKEIGSSAFYGCSSLISITLPNSLTSINTYAFNECNGLKAIYISNGLSALSSYAFSNCQKLSTIYIPKSIKTINKNCFPSDASLFKVFYEGSESDWKNISIDETDGGNNYLLNASIVFNSTITSLNYVENDDFSYILSSDNHAYSLAIINKSITTFDFSTRLSGKTVESIDYSGFYNCDSLRGVTIPNSVEFIGKYAFDNCNNLKSVSLPNKLTSINVGLFRYCNYLSEITIPKTVKSIGQYAFYSSYNSSAQVHVFFGGTESEWNAINIDSSNNKIQSPRIDYSSSVSSLSYVLDEKWYYFLGNDNGIYSFTYTASSSGQDFNYSSITTSGRVMKSLGSSAFHSSYLSTITLPNTLVYIGYDALYSSTNTTQIYFDGTVEEWEAIEKDSDWNNGIKSRTIHCLDGDVSAS